MTIPNDTLIKMQSLSSDKMAIVVNLVDQLTLTNPIDIFDELCKNGSENPMTESEVVDFVSNVRSERNATCN